MQRIAAKPARVPAPTPTYTPPTSDYNYTPPSKADISSNTPTYTRDDFTYTSNYAKEDKESGFRLGTLLGYGLPYFSNIDIGDAEAGLTMELGFVFIFPLIESVDLEVNVLYSLFKNEYKKKHSSSVSVQTIEVPVMFRYGTSFYVGSGVKIGFPIEGRVRASYKEEYWDLNKPEISLAVGGGFILGSFQFAAKYFIPITPFAKYNGQEATRGGLFLELVYFAI